MSRTLGAAAAEAFDDDVLHEYQGMGGISHTTTRRENVHANPYHFRNMGKGLAQRRGATQSDVTAMDVSHAKVPCTLEDWVAPEYTDLFDDAQINIDEQRELAQTISGGIGRRDDQLVIDAFDASSTYAGTVTVAIGGADTNLNVAKLRRASRYLNDKGVGSSGRHILVSALNLEALLGETEATSSDFNTVKALVNGEINSFVGFQFHIIEDRSAFEGGLAIDGSDIRDGYAYHESAIGYANALMRTEVNYIPTKTSWLANGLLKAGSVVRNSNGVVKVQMDET